MEFGGVKPSKSDLTPFEKFHSGTASTTNEPLLTKEDSQVETGASPILIDRANTEESDGFQFSKERMRLSSFLQKPTLRQRSAEIFECLHSFDINKLIMILSKLDTEEALELINLVDESGQTLIIRAAYDNTHKISEYLIFYYKTKLAKHLRSKEHVRLKIPEDQPLSEESLGNIKHQVRRAVADWINTPSGSDEGFYPLHFAAFHGNAKLIKLLIRNGADWTVRNKQGINMLHVSA
jgi:hypothetical protein